MNRKYSPEMCERALRMLAETRPSHPPLRSAVRQVAGLITGLINEHRDRFGVELICRVLRPALQRFPTSRGYRAAVGRSPLARRLRDDLLVPDLARLHSENYGVYGRWKSAVLPADLANRRFAAPPPRRLWVTYVATWSGFA